jgi:hypothetical protein
MSILSCLCADELLSVPNNPCDAVKYGNQIVKIFVQKMTGETFDGTNGNTVSVEADWDTKLAAVNDDRIVTISAPTTESGNEVPYGGEEVIDRPQEITFSLKYFKATTFANLDKIACWGKVRVWFLDNENYLWCSETTNGNGVEDASVLTTTLSQAGIGTRNKAENNKITWNNLCQPRPYPTALSFLKNKEGLSA